MSILRPRFPSSSVAGGTNLAIVHVAAYIRQSDEEGHRKDLSCPSQEQRFLEDLGHRSERGEALTHEIAPWDQGKSGGDMNRPGLQWLLENLDRFDEVWVYDHDRLVRHEFYAPLIMWELRSRGIRLWCSTGGADEETPMGRFMTDLRFRFGALYREQIAERTKLNRDHRLRQGLWSGHAPTGYKYVDEDGPGSRRLLVPDPEAAPKVKAIFAMLARGESQRKACASLGITQTTVIYQRNNPLYIGLVYKHRSMLEALEHRTYDALWALATDDTVDWIYPGRQEPLIDKATWDALELRRRTSPKNRVSPVYGLSGRFRCAGCGGTLRVSRNQGKRHPSLRCERCKWERSYRYGENAVLAALRIIAEAPEFEAAVEAELAREEPRESNLQALTAERAKLTRQLDRALDLLLETDEVSQQIRERAVGLKRRRDEVDRLIVQEKASLAARPTVMATWKKGAARLLAIPVAELWRAGTPDEQRDLLAAAFSRIAASRSEIVFEVRELGVSFRLPWTKGHVPHRQVAGRGIEPRTP